MQVKFGFIDDASHYLYLEPNRQECQRKDWYLQLEPNRQERKRQDWYLQLEPNRQEQERKRQDW
jgi:hypothetical protein